MKVNIVCDCSQLSSGKLPCFSLDPLKVYIDAHETPDLPSDNPSQYYTLVLAPFVVWGYMCKPFIDRNTD